MGELLTTKELCDYFKCNQKTVYKLYNDPTFPTLKIGRDYRTDKNLLEKWIEKKVKFR